VVVLVVGGFVLVAVSTTTTNIFATTVKLV
jgi:hypothetical protein